MPNCNCFFVAVQHFISTLINGARSAGLPVARIHVRNGSISRLLSLSLLLLLLLLLSRVLSRLLSLSFRRRLLRP